MNSWTGDVESDDGDDSSEEQSGDDLDNFEAQFEKAVRGSGSVMDLPEKTLFKNIDQVEDVDLLKEGWLQSEGEMRNIIESQVEEVGGSVEDFEDDSESDDAADETEDDSDESESTSSGWGGSTEEDDSEEEDESEAPEPAIESAEEIEEAEAEEEDETVESESSGASEDSGGPPVPESAVTPEAAAQRDQRWKVLVWGPPKLFKTHFCYTMPEPIAYIDTEGKADDIARKFADKDMQIWQPKEMTAEPDTKFRRAKKALDEAMEWLEWHRENEGKVGTIVVDSMTLMWEWAQRHHKIENYPLKDPDEVELSANFKSSQESDWAVVKEYHNGEFRERITDSPFHFCWTAMEREAFEETIGDDENRRFLEPIGERDNDYKADTIIRARKDKDRGKVGDLVGSNLVDNTFVGLSKPTFPKVRDAIESIQRAESSENPKSRSALSDEIEAETIIDYDPQVYVQQ